MDDLVQEKMKKEIYDLMYKEIYATRTDVTFLEKTLHNECQELKKTVNFHQKVIGFLCLIFLLHALS